MIRKDGIIQYADAGKTVYLGSYLAMIYPTYTLRAAGLTRYPYPFLLVSDSNWTVACVRACPWATALADCGGLSAVPLPSACSTAVGTWWLDLRASGLAGTPAFFINGRLLSGAQPPESFIRVIEEELARGR